MFFFSEKENSEPIKIKQQKSNLFYVGPQSLTNWYT